MRVTPTFSQHKAVSGSVKLLELLNVLQKIQHTQFMRSSNMKTDPLSKMLWYKKPKKAMSKWLVSLLLYTIIRILKAELVSHFYF
jgi:hypothetical protein